jgi:ArsR family transcriptional regulator, arsenate/arsenite/antimonite-responsive transcriptional repressor
VQPTRSYLECLYAAIKLLPDAEREFATDLTRFRKRMRLREGGRCRIGLQTAEIAVRIA